MMTIMIVEDNVQLRQALGRGLEQTGKVKVIYNCEAGEQALDYCLQITAPGAGGSSPQ